MKPSVTTKITSYWCEDCQYITNNKTDYRKHIATPKHSKKTTNVTLLSQKSHNSKYLCLNCDIEFNNRTTLWRHKKKCINSENKTETKTTNIDYNDEPNYKELLLISLKQNKEMQEFIIKQSEQQQKTIEQLVKNNENNHIIENNYNNTIISNNFNLNLFLNEKCKDAITMDEFLNKIQVSLSNLVYTKEKGIAEGLSKIFIENMNKIPLTQRPIHCTDVKRETIYIKNEKWEKDEDKIQTKDVIKKLSNIQIKNICKFKEAHPDLMKNDKQKNDYMELIKATTDDIQNKEEKVIKSICKNIYIKDNLI
jgi:hypothetical protein